MALRRVILCVVGLLSVSTTAGCFILYRSVPEIEFEIAPEIDGQKLEVTSMTRGRAKIVDEERVSVWIPGDSTARFRVSDGERTSELDGFMRASTGLKGPHWSFDRVRLLDGSLWLPAMRDPAERLLQFVGHHASPEEFLAGYYPGVGWWAPSESDIKVANVQSSTASGSVMVGDGIRCEGAGGCSVVLSWANALEDRRIQLMAPLGSHCVLINSNGRKRVDFEFRTTKRVDWESSGFRAEWFAPKSGERLVSLSVPDTVAIGGISFSSMMTSERHLQARR